MPFRIVQSKQNARLKQLRRALAAPARDGGALAGIEGPNLLAEALRAGLRIPAIFVAQGSERLVEGLPVAADTETLVVPKALLDSALTTESPQPVAALVEPPDWTWAHLLGDRKTTVPLVVVLAGLQDPGNLGTILRSVEAFGATGVVSLPGTVSAWNPKAVRASAGSVFRVPLIVADPEECFLRLRQAGVELLTTTAEAQATTTVTQTATTVAQTATTAARTIDKSRSASGHDFSRAARSQNSGGALAPELKGTGFSPYVDRSQKKGALAPDASAPAQPAYLVNLAAPVAILIGNEGNGVPAELAAQADGAITIPCPGPVESLNAAVAASVLLYEASRQRSAEHRTGARR
jgi:RNA methyltransferase, TrmH family